MTSRLVLTMHGPHEVVSCAACMGRAAIYSFTRGRGRVDTEQFSSYSTGASMHVRRACAGALRAWAMAFVVVFLWAGSAAAAFWDAGNVFVTIWERGEGGKEITIDLETLGYTGSSIDEFANNDEDGDGQNGYAEIITPDVSFFNTSEVSDLYVAFWGGTQNNVPLLPDRDQGDRDIFFSSTVSDVDTITSAVTSVEVGEFLNTTLPSGSFLRAIDGGGSQGGANDAIAQQGVTGVNTDATNSFADNFANDGNSLFGSYQGKSGSQSSGGLFNDNDPAQNTGFLSLADSQPLYLYHYFSDVSRLPFPPFTQTIGDPVPVTDDFLLALTVEEVGDGTLKLILDADPEANVPPSFETTPEQVQNTLNTAVQGAPTILAITISDSDNDNINPANYSLTFSGEDGSALGRWLRLQSRVPGQAGTVVYTFSGTPNNDHVGPYNVTLVATDNIGDSTTLDVAFTVQNLNDAPVLDAVPAFVDPCLTDDDGVDNRLAVNATVPQSIRITAEDLDAEETDLDVPADASEALTYQLVGDVPNGLPGSGVMTQSSPGNFFADIAFDLSGLAPGQFPAERDYSFTLVVDDGSDSVSEVIDLRVFTATAPVIEADQDAEDTRHLSPRLNTPFDSNTILIDPDGSCASVLTFQLALDPFGGDGGKLVTTSAELEAEFDLSFDEATGRIQGTVTDANDVGKTGTLTLSVTDETGLNDIVVYEFAVQDIQDAPPVFQDEGVDLPVELFNCAGLLNGNPVTALNPLEAYVSDSNDRDDVFFDLDFEAEGLPPGLTISRDNGTISGTPNVADLASTNFSRQFDVSVTVTDNQGLQDSTSFTLFVYEDADPVFTAVPNTTVPISSTEFFDSDSNAALVAGYQLLVVDANDGIDCGHFLRYNEETPGSLAAAGLSLDTATGRITGMPTATGVFPVTIIVEDNTGRNISTSFSFNITDSTIPLFDALGEEDITAPAEAQIELNEDSTSIIVAAGSQVIITPQVNNREPGEVDYSVRRLNGDLVLPPGMSIDPNTGIFTSTTSLPGLYELRIAATDNTSSLTGFIDFSITVFENTAPSILPAGPEFIEVGQAFSFTPSVVDPNPGTSLLQFSATGLPSGFSIDADNGTVSGSTSETNTNAQGFFAPFPIAITVTDVNSGLSSPPQVFDVTVFENVAPDILNTPGTVDIALNQDFSGFVPEVFDPNALQPQHTLTYNYSGLPAGLSFNSTSGIISGQATESGDDFMVRLDVEDNTGLKDFLLFNLNVFENVAPVIQDVPETTVTFGEPISVEVVADDENALNDSGHFLNFEVFGLPVGLDVIGLPFGNSISETEDRILLVGNTGPGEDEVGPGSFTISVFVTDNQNVTTATAFKINVGLTQGQFLERIGALQGPLYLLR